VMVFEDLLSVFLEKSAEYRHEWRRVARTRGSRNQAIRAHLLFPLSDPAATRATGLRLEAAPHQLPLSAGGSGHFRFKTLSKTRCARGASFATVRDFPPRSRCPQTPGPKLSQRSRPFDGPTAGHPDTIRGCAENVPNFGDRGREAGAWRT